MVLEQLRVANVAPQRVQRLVRDTSIILKIEAPLAAADVRKPDRSECPENRLASKPARSA
jgi:hypothetical protein